MLLQRWRASDVGSLPGRPGEAEGSPGQGPLSPACVVWHGLLVVHDRLGEPMTTPAKKQMDELSVEECFDLLKTKAVGRLAYVDGGKPRILPLNYDLHQGSVVFRIGYGDLLDAIHNRDVEFEADNADADAHVGWSVIVHGVAEEIWKPEELELARQLSLRPWAPGDRDHYVRILSSSITGRRID